MADVQWAGRVGGNEFDLQLAAAAGLVMAETLTLLLNLANHCLLSLGTQMEIDETGTGDLDTGDVFGGGQCLDQTIGDSARILAQWLGQYHGQVAGKIAVICILRTLQLNIERQAVRADAIRVQAFCGDAE